MSAGARGAALKAVLDQLPAGSRTLAMALLLKDEAKWTDAEAEHADRMVKWVELMADGGAAAVGPGT